MNLLEERIIACPYCGEQQTVLVDCSEQEQHYIEDCQVCCRPIVFKVHISMSGDLNVAVQTEGDADW